MADPAPPPGFAVDEAPPPGFTVDAPAQADATAQTDQTAAAAPTVTPEGAGFTDPEKQQILAYIPHAKDPADLEQFSLQVSGGKSKIANAADILAKRDQGAQQFGWAPAKVDKSMGQAQVDPSLTNPLTLDHIRQTVGDALLNLITPGLGVQSVAAAQDSGAKPLIEHIANAAVADYGPEVGGVIDKILNGGDLGVNVAHERAMLEGDSADHPVASIFGELTGAGLTGALGNEAGLANAARGVKIAAGMGTGAAYGSGAAGPGNRVGGGLTGSAIGSATEVAIPAVKALVGSSAGKAANQAFADAADRQGVSYMAADLPKAPKSKFATALTSLTFGGIPLAEQGEKNIASAASAAGRAASDVGQVGDRTAAGQAAQTGAKQFMDTTEAKMGALYDAIPIPADAPANVSTTRLALDNLAQSFPSNPKLAAAFKDPRIATYLDALTPSVTKEPTGLLDAAGNPIMRDVTHGGGLSWNDLKDFRTRVGQIIGQPGLTSDGHQITQLRALYGALSDDMRATAETYGPAAQNAFLRANRYARARSDRIENVVSVLLGPNNDKAPQTAFEALQRLANEKGGDPLKLARALRSMPQNEANSVRATVLDDLGTASAGRQNDKGDVFSTSDWVTNWNKLSDRAKNVLVPPEHRKALDDLALLFSGMKSSTKFANSSKTGLFVAASHTAAMSFAHPVLGAIDAALQYSGGKLLASPAFARKLAATPLNKAGATAFWSRPWVQAMASKNPAIAAEIRAFQAAFLNAANDNSATLATTAAQPQQQEQN